MPRTPDDIFMNVLPLTEQDNSGPDVATEVRNFVLGFFPLARKKHINNSDALLESGLVDSQGVLEVVSYIERRFSATVEDHELVPENFQTIDCIAAFVRKKTAPQSPGSDLR
jgi:acyl carrier protein